MYWLDTWQEVLSTGEIGLGCCVLFGFKCIFLQNGSTHCLDIKCNGDGYQLDT